MVGGRAGIPGWTVIAVLAAGAAVPAARAQDPCQVYAEAFEHFAGPQDLDDGTFRVQWCPAGASVVAASFCPTDGALRLASVTHDPIVRVEPPADCTSVTISLDYSQFAATGTVLRWALAGDATLDCGAFVAAAGPALAVTGGACTTVTHTVTPGPGQSVYWKLDHGGGTGAVFVDNVRISVTGCCGSDEHGCCEIGGPGCDDAKVRDCVCVVDPYCCEVEWDALCVQEVEAFGCGACGGTTECPVGIAADFGTTFVPGAVCATFPEVFESCEGAGPYLSSVGACGDVGDMSMRFGPGFPYSAAVTRCFALPPDMPTRLEFVYTKNTGTLGPRLDMSLDGEPFFEVWQAPITFPGGCAVIVVDLEPIAGATDVRARFSSGSSIDNGARIDDVAITLGPPPHACCETGGPGCTDEAVEACVCAFDAYCCDVAWDALCVLEVEQLGCGACGPAADLDGDGDVDFTDVLLLIAAWGPCGPGACAADLDGDGSVGFADILALLAEYDA
jgi:hypothetical protein